MGNCSAPSFIVTSLGIGLSWASAAHSPFKGRFFSRLINYARSSLRSAVTVNARENQQERISGAAAVVAGNTPCQSMPLSTIPSATSLGFPEGQVESLGWLLNLCV